MSAAIKLSIDSDLDQVVLIARAVRALCSDLLGEEGTDQVELSVVEAINNVIKHGYAGSRGRDVEVQIGLEKARVVIQIIDTAHPMDQKLLDASTASPFVFDESDLHSVPEGGMGLALIQMNMDEVDYGSVEGRNCLRMIKYVVCEGA